MLDKVSFEKAVNYIRREARPLEKSLLEHQFFSGSPKAALDELKKFQNPDGGFGKALEPDCRMSQSSVLATTFALDILVALKTTADNPILKSAAAYLNSTLDRQNLIWRFLPHVQENYPRAPWWAQDNLSATFNNFIENPRVKICSYGFKYPALFDKDLMDTLLSTILNHMATRTDIASVHDLLCYMALECTTELPEKAQKLIHNKVGTMIEASVETDPENWKEYCLKPLQLIKSPESPYLSLISEAVEQNLAYEANNQTDGGNWLPNWSWAGQFPKDWEKAKAEWSGYVTLENLKIFKSFDPELGH